MVQESKTYLVLCHNCICLLHICCCDRCSQPDHCFVLDQYRMDRGYRHMRSRNACRGHHISPPIFHLFQEIEVIIFLARYQYKSTSVDKNHNYFVVFCSCSYPIGICCRKIRTQRNYRYLLDPHTRDPKERCS